MCYAGAKIEKGKVITMTDINMYDVVILGSGPAGLTAALYTASVIEEAKSGAIAPVTAAIVAIILPIVPEELVLAV